MFGLWIKKLTVVKYNNLKNIVIWLDAWSYKVNWSTSMNSNILKEKPPSWNIVHHII